MASSISVNVAISSFCHSHGRQFNKLNHISAAFKNGNAPFSQSLNVLFFCILWNGNVYVSRIPQKIHPHTYPHSIALFFSLVKKIFKPNAAVKDCLEMSFLFMPHDATLLYRM